jgi:hypothetical protein
MVPSAPITGEVDAPTSTLDGDSHFSLPSGLSA